MAGRAEPVEKGPKTRKLVALYYLSCNRVVAYVITKVPN